MEGDKKKILFLYSEGGAIVTGGQRYEDYLYRLLCAMPHLEVERIWLNNISNKLSKYTSPLRNLRLVRRLRRYDLVFFNSVSGLNFTPLAWALTRIAGVHTAVIHHHFLHCEKSGVKRLWYRMLEMNFMRAAGSIVVPSPYINELCTGLFPRKQVLYWQIPFSSRRVASPLQPVPGNLLYIGTIEPRKGLHLLMDAMQMLKERGVDVRLTVVGKTVSGSYRRMLEDKIASGGLAVRFTGFISAEEKDAIVASADLLAFPSRLEGYGMVLCESMVNGLPVVCFNNSAMPYTVRHGVNGLLAADGDATALANALQSIVADRALRSRLSEGALATVPSFMSPERFARQVESEISLLLR